MNKKNRTTKNSKLALGHETVRLLAKSDMALVEGGFGASANCTVSGPISKCGCATE
jgi:hypothetical protein